MHCLYVEYTFEDSRETSIGLCPFLDVCRSVRPIKDFDLIAVVNWGVVLQVDECVSRLALKLYHTDSRSATK
jgi:hypothetical protein